VIAGKGAIQKAGISAELIEEVYMGQVIQAGSGQAPDRQVTLGLGCRKDTPSTTINKVCASGMKSVMLAAQAIRVGDRHVMLAGGMENMSLAPHLMYLRKGTAYGHSQAMDIIQSDALTDVYNKILMGTCTEKLCSELGITRQAQDEYAIGSYEKARAAQQNGIFDWEITPIVEKDKKGKEIKIDRDEECQKFFPDKFSSLRAVFAKDGTITPANASKINDGAAAMVVMSEAAAKKHGLKPLARIVSYADASVDPIDFGIAPAKATQYALKIAGLEEKDIHFHEINEAFAAVVLANMKLGGIKAEKVNIHGGAVALGHPLGVSGARILISLLNVLRTKEAKYGMASICNGGGGASAVILERL